MTVYLWEWEGFGSIRFQCEECQGKQYQAAQAITHLVRRHGVPLAAAQQQIEALAASQRHGVQTRPKEAPGVL